MSNDRTDRIREPADRIWIREGQSEGCDREYSHQAELELAQDGETPAEHDDAGLVSIASLLSLQRSRHKNLKEFNLNGLAGC